MKLAELLASGALEALRALGKDHLPDAAEIPDSLLASSLESALHSLVHVERAVSRWRQPPTFSILVALLEAEGHSLAEPDLKEQALSETRRICAEVDAGECVGSQSEIYRRVLQEARRSDLDLDPSERALLSVLRRTLGMAHVEHFLIEHHADLRGFWDNEDAFERELEGLLGHGVLFRLDDGSLVLPSDLVGFVRRTLDVEMGRAAIRRLYHCMSSSALSEALQKRGAKISGTKETKVERLVGRMASARDVLDELRLAELRDLAKGVNCGSSGAKDDLVERLILHFESGSDLQVPEEAPPPPEQEPRVLSQERFEALFSRLRGKELGRILDRWPELRQSGTKTVRIGTLWASHLSEISMLTRLSNPRLRQVLERCGLRLSGSKGDRIDRLVAYFEQIDLGLLEEATESDEGEIPGPSADSSDELAVQEDLEDIPGSGETVRSPDAGVDAPRVAQGEAPSALGSENPAF